MDIKSAYLVGNFFLLLIWLFLFLLRKDLRKHQLTVSILSAPLAPITQILWFYNDYWRPEYLFEIVVNGVPLGLEEPLFAFLAGGIGSVIYESLFHKNYRAGNGTHRHVQTFFIIFISLILFIVLKSLGVNTIWACTAALVSMSLAIIYFDKLLRIEVLFSGLFMLFIAIFVYAVWLWIFPEAVQTLWVQNGLSGIGLWGIPIEELAWFFAWGMFSGVIYEFWMNEDPISIGQSIYIG